MHHGKNTQYIDKNYGNLLIIWDRFFGTYQKEEDKVIYGLTEDLCTNNPIEITFHTWREILEEIRRAKSWNQIIKIIIGPPYSKIKSSSIDSKESRNAATL